jgi:hypothetical protein
MTENTLNIFKARNLALASLLAFSFSTHAQTSFWGSGEDATPSLSIAAAEITIDIPMSLNTGNLEQLLAQASSGSGLSELKAAEVRKYTQHLHSEFASQLIEYFNDEQVPLLQENAALQLRNALSIKVIKNLSALKPRKEFDLEQGTVVLSGEFQYQLRNRAGSALREQRVDIGKLKIKENYRVKTPHDGSAAEDDTEQAIKRALTEMSENILKEIEDNLEADKLREMAAL